MPFTPTHILAVLPIAALRRPALPFSALVIGSMIPDFPLFVPLGPGYAATHSPAGVITACLPLGLAWFALFQWLMKRPLLALLPGAIRHRCATLAAPRSVTSPGALALAAAAVAIGASTHLLWDSFTHRGRWGTLLVPALNGTAFTLRGQDVPGYKALQYGSTLVGLPGLGLILAAWLRRRMPEPREDVPALPMPWMAFAWFVTLAVPAAVFLVVFARGDRPAYDRLGRSITTSGLALMTLTLAYVLAFRFVEWRKGRA